MSLPIPAPRSETGPATTFRFQITLARTAPDATVRALEGNRATTALVAGHQYLLEAPPYDRVDGKLVFRDASSGEVLAIVTDHVDEVSRLGPVPKMG